MCNEHEDENDSKYFMKKVPIYNRNFNSKNKNKNKNDNDKHTLHGACFFASIGVNLARNIEEEGILITPVAPLLKMRKNISGPSEDYDEESLDKDTISLVVMLAPGIFSSHDEVVEFASNIKQLQDMDENNSFLSDCDEKPYQRSSINIGFSETSYYFFYEFKKLDLVADETSWELSDDDGSIIDSVEEGEYTEIFTEHVHEGCINLDSCVIFTIFDSLGDVCEDGSNNYYWCGYWASIGLCENNQVKDWMQENCAKACANCYMDYHNDEFCEDRASDGRCTDTSSKSNDVTWQEYMQASCRVSCNTCDVDFNPSPTPTQLICSDDQFKYEIIVTNDDDDDDERSSSILWMFYYKYSVLIDESLIDSFSGEFPPNYEKRYYGCAMYSCFELRVGGAYLKIYNYDEDILIAQNTERWEKLRFCQYAPEPITQPLVEAIITITLEFSTSQSNYEDISKVVQRSVMKILFHAQIDDENIVMDILDSSCEDESKILCDISFQICEGPCGEGEEPDFLAFVGNTMNEVEANGQLLQTINASADHMDVGILDSDTKVHSIFYDFEYEAWPTTSPTTSPSSATPTQDCNTPDVVQSLFDFITKIFESITQAITNATDPISDVLFGVESCSSSDITCADKMFELHLEILTDGSPEKTSWELLYEDGTIIDSIVQDTYSECDTVYNHSYCLDTSCFVFNMFDSFEFKGSYNITVGDTVVARGDSFLWWKDTKRFCYPQCDDDDNMFALQIELMTDDWPRETSWDLTFDNGTIVDHVNKRYYTGRNTVYNHRYCLRDGCYDVTFHYHIGDGICCSYGEGSFKIKIDDKVIREGGEFEDNVRKSFCHITAETSDEENNSFLFGIITDLFGDEICCTTDTTGYPTPNPTITSQPSILPSSNPSLLLSSNPSFNPTTSLQPSIQQSIQPSSNPSSKPSSFCNENKFKYEVVVTTDEYPEETSWELKYSDGTIIDSVEEGNYTEKNTEHVHEGCLDLDSCVAFTIFDSYGDGISEGGGYTILANDVVMAEGGEFDYNETKTFCYPVPETDSNNNLPTF